MARHCVLGMCWGHDDPAPPPQVDNAVYEQNLQNYFRTHPDRVVNPEQAGLAAAPDRDPGYGGGLNAWLQSYNAGLAQRRAEAAAAAAHQRSVGISNELKKLGGLDDLDLNSIFKPENPLSDEEKRKQVYIAALQKQGVPNAQQVVDQAVQNQKIDLSKDPDANSLKPVLNMGLSEKMRAHSAELSQRLFQAGIDPNDNSPANQQKQADFLGLKSESNAPEQFKGGSLGARTVYDEAIGSKLRDQAVKKGYDPLAPDAESSLQATGMNTESQQFIREYNQGLRGLASGSPGNLLQSWDLKVYDQAGNAVKLPDSNQRIRYGQGKDPLSNLIKNPLPWWTGIGALAGKGAGLLYNPNKYGNPNAVETPGARADVIATLYNTGDPKNQQQAMNVMLNSGLIPQFGKDYIDRKTQEVIQAGTEGQDVSKLTKDQKDALEEAARNEAIHTFIPEFMKNFAQTQAKTGEQDPTKVAQAALKGTAEPSAAAAAYLNSLNIANTPVRTQTQAQFEANKLKDSLGDPTKLHGLAGFFGSGLATLANTANQSILSGDQKKRAKDMEESMKGLLDQANKEQAMGHPDKAQALRDQAQQYLPALSAHKAVEQATHVSTGRQIASTGLAGLDIANLVTLPLLAGSIAKGGLTAGKAGLSKVLPGLAEQRLTPELSQAALASTTKGLEGLTVPTLAQSPNLVTPGLKEGLKGLTKSVVGGTVASSGIGAGAAYAAGGNLEDVKKAAVHGAIPGLLLRGLSGKKAFSPYQAADNNALRDIIYKKLSQSPTFDFGTEAGANPGRIRRASRDFVTNVRGLGGTGKEIAARTMNTVNDQQLFNTYFSQKMPTVQRLSRGEGKDLAAVAEGKKDISEVSPRVAQAHKEWDGVRQEIYSMAVQLKSMGAIKDVGQISNYFPHMFGGGLFGKARRFGVDAEQASNPVFTHKSNLEQTRSANLEGYRTDPGVLFDYVDSVAKSFAQARNFSSTTKKGKYLDSSRTANNLIDRLGGQGASREMQDYTQKGLQRVFGTDRGAGHAVSRALRNVNVLTKLGLGGITNLQQVPANTGALYGHTKVARAVGELAGANRADALKYVHDTGVAHEAHVEAIKRDTGFAANRTIGKVGAPLFTPIEKGNRAVTAVTGRIHAEDMAKRAATGDAKAIRELDNLGLDGKRISENGGALTYEDKVTAGRSAVERTQFVPDVARTPLWASSPAGRVVSQFRTFGYKQTQLVNHMVREAKAGNTAPLIRYMMGVVPIGTAATGVTDALRQSMAEGGAKILGQQAPQQKDRGPLEQLKRAFNKAGGLGLYSDVPQYFGKPFKGANKEETQDSIAGNILGPTADNILKLKEVLHGDAKDFERWATQQIPVAGPSLAKLFSGIKVGKDQTALVDQLRTNINSLGRQGAFGGTRQVPLTDDEVKLLAGTVSGSVENGNLHLPNDSQEIYKTLKQKYGNDPEKFAQAVQAFQKLALADFSMRGSVQDVYDFNQKYGTRPGGDYEAMIAARKIRDKQIDEMIPSGAVGKYLQGLSPDELRFLYNENLRDAQNGDPKAQARADAITPLVQGYIGEAGNARRSNLDTATERLKAGENIGTFDVTKGFSEETADLAGASDPMRRKVLTDNPQMMADNIINQINAFDQAKINAGFKSPFTKAFNFNLGDPIYTGKGFNRKGVSIEDVLSGKASLPTKGGGGGGGRKKGGGGRKKGGGGKGGGGSSLKLPKLSLTTSAKKAPKPKKVKILSLSSMQRKRKRTGSLV